MLKVETLHHVAISVTDLARSKDFYANVLGLEEIPRPPFPFAGAWFRVGNRELHLIVASDPTLRVGKPVTLQDGHFAIRVSSFKGAIAHLESKGCSVDSNEPGRSMRVNPSSVTGYPQIHMLDPDRNIVEINAASAD